MILAGIIRSIRWSWWLQWRWRWLMITVGVTLLEWLLRLWLLCSSELLLFWLCWIRDIARSIWSEDWPLTKKSRWLVFLGDLWRRWCSELVIIRGCICIGFLEHTELLVLRGISVSAGGKNYYKNIELKLWKIARWLSTIRI